MREITRVADLDDLGVFTSEAYKDHVAAIIAHRDKVVAFEAARVDWEQMLDREGSQREYDTVRRRFERARRDLQKADAERYHTTLVWLHEIEQKQHQ